MLKFFHHLFNPHCEQCAHEKECKTCDTMKMELEKERYEKLQVLNRLLDLTRPQVHDEQRPPSMDLKPIQIGRKHVPWDVKRAELEAQHRLVIEKTENRDKEIEDLEKKLGVNQNAS